MSSPRLKYFVAVAEDLSFRRASIRLRIAQPALSRQIRILEEEVGVELFERLPRGICLTEAGRSYLEDAYEIARLSKQARDRAVAVATGSTGTLRVGLQATMLTYPIVQSIFRAFGSEFGEVHFRFISSTSYGQEDLLLANSVDVGFAYDWEKPSTKLHSLPLVRDELGIVLNRDHRLVKLDNITADDIRDESFLWPDVAPLAAHSAAILHACAVAGFLPKITHHGLSSLEYIMGLVAAGLGVAIVPFSSVQENDHVVVRPVVGLSHPLKMMVLWQPDNKSASLANFLRQARSCAQDDEV